MLNSQIHEGLEGKEVRDLLSTNLAKCFIKDMHNQKVHITKTSDMDILDWAVLDAEAELKYSKNKLSIKKEKRAIAEIIKLLGWSEYDVSDETQYDLGDKLRFGNGNHLWMNFIGTQTEYDNLIKKIETNEG